ncbi:hypothetical protein IJO12_02110 [bacterium]|nr:hypothetical protein [bacterium]
MADEKQEKVNNQEGKVIDEQNYQFSAPKQKGPAAIGRGGDPFFRRIYVPNEQIQELLEETITVQDWVQRETSNNVALACLDNENLKDIYFQIKDGFGDYGPILLMGFKTPQGVEIPRLKVLDTNGEVINILTGPFAIDELNKRALAYRESKNSYEVLENTFAEETEEVEFQETLEEI